MKIAIVMGICVERDAISAAAANQAELLAESASVDDVVLVAQAFDRKTSVRQVVAASSWELLNLDEVIGSDLVIFHWGIRYDLFNALPLIALQRATVVHFHNLTPAELVDESDRPTIEESLRQVQLPLLTGTPVWTESRYNMDTLRSWGFPPKAVRFMPFPIDPMGPLPTADRTPRSAGVRLLTVGRVVPAKGVHVLVDAMASVVAEATVPVDLVLVGSSQLSDGSFVDDLHERIERLGLASRVDVRLDLTDDELWREYCQADVLVVPSFHEGLCVPVIEAYMAGCRVVATDAGNLPNVVCAPDPIVPVGDSRALATAITEMVDEIATSGVHVPPTANDLIETYARAASFEMLRDGIAELVGGSAGP